MFLKKRRLHRPMRRIDENFLNDKIEEHLMQIGEDETIYSLNRPAREEIMRRTRQYEVDNLRDLLEEDNWTELTFTEPLSQRINNAKTEAIKKRFAHMTVQELFEWQRYNFDHEENEKLRKYLRLDHSLSYSVSINLVSVHMYSVYAINFRPEIHKTWQALEFEVYDGTGAKINAIALYRQADYQDDTLYRQLQMVQQLSGSQPVDITFIPLPITFVDGKKQTKQAEPTIRVHDIHRIRGDREKELVPVPVEYERH